VNVGRALYQSKHSSNLIEELLIMLIVVSKYQIITVIVTCDKVCINDKNTKFDGSFESSVRELILHKQHFS
jgi:hypothetical protein